MKITAASIAVFSMLVMTAVHADDAIRTVTVDGKASITAAPDLAHVSMAVQARSLDLGQARERVVSVTREFLDFCDAQDIDASRIRTTGLTIHPQYRWNEETNRQELQAYVVRRQLDVEIIDLDQLGTVIEGAADVGVNEVSQPQLASSREDDLHREALAAAARDARSNALVLAETLGVSLGPIVEITAQRQPGLRPVPMMERVQLASADGAAQTYAAGEIRFEANVSARFELTDAK
jgi:uncharacterized protein YggE